MTELDRQIRELEKQIQCNSNGFICVPESMQVTLDNSVYLQFMLYRENVKVLNTLGATPNKIRTYYADNVPYFQIKEQLTECCCDIPKKNTDPPISLDKADYNIPGYTKASIKTFIKDKIIFPKELRWLKFWLCFNIIWCGLLQFTPTYTSLPLIGRLIWQICVGLVLGYQAKNYYEKENYYEKQLSEQNEQRSEDALFPEGANEKTAGGTRRRSQ